MPGNLFGIAIWHGNAMVPCMNGTISLDKFGRVVIPKEFRDKAGTNTFAPSWTPKGLLFEPVIEKPRRLIKVRGRLILADDGETRNAVDDVRADRNRHG